MIQLLLLFKRRLGKGRRDFTCVIFSLGARVASRRTCCCGSSRVCKQIKIWVSLILLLLRPSAINQTFVTVSAGGTDALIVQVPLACLRIGRPLHWLNSPIKSTVCASGFVETELPLLGELGRSKREEKHASIPNGHSNSPRPNAAAQICSTR